MPQLIYSLCALTSIACAWLLLRSYTRNRQSMLLWSGLCFVGLSLNNLILVLDKLVFPSIDLSTPRMAAALVGLLLLLYGLLSYDE